MEIKCSIFNKKYLQKIIQSKLLERNLFQASLGDVRSDYTYKNQDSLKKCLISKDWMLLNFEAGISLQICLGSQIKIF